MKSKYELSEAAYSWVTRQGISTTERQRLMEDLRKELKQSANMRRLLLEVAEAAESQDLGPLDCIALGINYGAAMVLAHALEQQRRAA